MTRVTGIWFSTSKTGKRYFKISLGAAGSLVVFLQSDADKRGPNSPDAVLCHQGLFPGVQTSVPPAKPAPKKRARKPKAPEAVSP